MIFKSFSYLGSFFIPQNTNTHISSIYQLTFVSTKKIANVKTRPDAPADEHS